MRRTRAWCCGCGCPTPARWWSCPRSSGAIPGEAVDLIVAAFPCGLVVEGLSFHVGSQCTNFENFVQALNMAAAVMRESAARGHTLEIAGHRRRVPGRYDRHVDPSACWRKRSTRRSAPLSRRHPDHRRARAFPRGDGRRGVAALSARRCATGSRATTSTTASTTPSRHHIRPLPVSAEGVPQGKAGRSRAPADLQRAGQHLAIRGSAGA